ncbi:MAG TPA: hypothetical protein VEK38_01300 [Candidatus Bathyarchaeia archaeon]|nr:hypothetical protein [Candidatus Bathyarchaeia archaeon]
MMIFFIFAMMTGFVYTNANPERFVLITMLYNETNEERVQEYLTCLEQNRKHPLIRKIHIIYDRSHDKKGPTLIHNYIKKYKFPVDYVDGRATYGFCFNLAAEKYPEKKIILCNADIYFNETLNLLASYDFTNLFIALTRWNESESGVLNLEFSGTRPNILSQDAWLFRSPLPRFCDTDIYLGTFFCDSQIAYQAYRAGLMLMNPCLSVQCCHLHCSRVRNYAESPKNDRKKLGVPWIHLPPSVPVHHGINLDMEALAQVEPLVKNFIPYDFCCIC